MLEYVFIAFIVILCIQFIFYTLIFGAFSFTKKPLQKNTPQLPVSVLICAKNEAENLRLHIPYFLEQNYSTFELVLINDCSVDDTLDVIEEFKERFPSKIKIVNVKENENFWGNKKYALTLGIKAATFENLLFSDADCKPVSQEWISEMVSHFSHKQIILGYGAYEKIKHSFLNKLIRFETLMTAIQYFSYAKVGMPYMGVGRNLAYTKSVFFNVNGFIKHIKLKSGDDDLFVNEVATKHNTSICFSENSFTVSAPKTTFKEWIHQKRRHISTAKFYKPVHKILLGIFYISQILFWLLSAILLAFLYQWQFVLPLIAVRLVFFYASVGFSAKKLNETDLIFLSPLFEIFLIFIQLIIFIKNLISKPLHW